MPLLSKLGAIFSLIKLLPEIFSTVKSLIAVIKQMKVDAKARATLDAFEKAIKTGDSTDLERELGVENAGEYTKHRIEGLKTREEK